MFLKRYDLLERFLINYQADYWKQTDIILSNLVESQWTKTTSAISRCGTFLPFLSLVILFLVLPNNFIVSGVKSSRLYPFLILNITVFSILLTYICPDGLLISSPWFFEIYSKQSWISDTEYDTSGNSNLSFHVGADILNLSVIVWAFYILNLYYKFIVIVWAFYIFPRVINTKIW